MPFPPIEPPETDVAFPEPETADEHGVVAVGQDFRPGTLLRAYRSGIFPWPHEMSIPGLRGLSSRHVVLWCSPDPRAHFPLEHEPHWSRSLRRTLRTTTFRVSQNEAFADVVRACGEARKGGTWIIPPLIEGYVGLHRLGHAHSVEVWDGPTLVGGIYGVAVGAAFAGESMFHTRTDASKIAFAHLVLRLRRSGFQLFDVQVPNPHLDSLGCILSSRRTYLEKLARASRQLHELA